MTNDICPVCLETTLHRFFYDERLVKETCENPKCGYLNPLRHLPVPTHDANGYPTHKQTEEAIEKFLCGE